MDRFSPLAPAFIRVLLLPVGRVERTRFLTVLKRLQNECSELQLSGLKSDGDLLGPLSPSIFPQGSLLFNFSAANPDEQAQLIAPFELFRQPLLVLGIVDGLEDGDDERKVVLAQAIEYLRERHPRVVYRSLVNISKQVDIEQENTSAILTVNNAEVEGDPSLASVVDQLSRRFLVELATYAKAVEASPAVQTPGQTARSLQTLGLASTNGGRSPLTYDLPTKPTSPASPDADNSSPRPSSRSVTMSPGPPTSFEQIQANAGTSEAIARSNSNRTKRNARSASQDRVSVHGFGPNTSQEKARTRGKARVGIVVGHIHLMAGQWVEAIKILVENSTRARLQSDHIWHGKGCEGILVALLLIARAGLEFTIPSICYATPDKSNKHVQRSSASIDEKSEESTAKKSRDRLSAILPDMSRLILNLYHTGDGPLELPSLVLSEAHIRFCKLLAFLRVTDGSLTNQTLQSLLRRQLKLPKQNAYHTSSPGLACSAITMILDQALPTPHDHLSVGDRVVLLSGIASTYSLLGMHRKKGLVMNEIMNVLGTALIQARKVGAAEAGIHPAATFSAEAVAENVLSMSDETGGLRELMADIAHTYGADLFISHEDALNVADLTSTFSRNHVLKIEILRSILTFCEALPDTRGIVCSIASILYASRIPGIVSPHDDSNEVVVSSEEQNRLASMAIRTVDMARHFGLLDVQVPYWDLFLVRDVEFSAPEAGREIVKRPIRLSGTSTVAPITGANPLLYDRNSSRPNTADANPEILVQNEARRIHILLQNPFGVALDVEPKAAWTEGASLEVIAKPFSLPPLSLQWIDATVVANSPGKFSVLGFDITISGCKSRRFTIFRRSWVPKAPLIIKDMGRLGVWNKFAGDTRPGMEARQPLSKTISGDILPVLPELKIGVVDIVESHVMLLDGERKIFNITICNASTVSANVVEMVGTKNVVRATTKLNGGLVIPPGNSHVVQLELTARAGESSAHMKFYYALATDVEDPERVRVVSTTIQTTVNAALRVQHADILSGYHADEFTLSFDIGNAWPHTISFQCIENQDGLEIEDGLSHTEANLAPGEFQRIYLQVRHQQATQQLIRPEDLRRHLLDRLQIRWSYDDRRGSVNLNSLTFSDEALQRTRAAPVHLQISLLEPNTVRVAQFATLRCELTNCAPTRSEVLVVDFQMANASGVRLDDRQVAFHGMLRQIVPPLLAEQKKLIDFTFCPLSRGPFEIQVTVRPANLGGTVQKAASWQGTCKQLVEVILD